MHIIGGVMQAHTTPSDAGGSPPSQETLICTCSQVFKSVSCHHIHKNLSTSMPRFSTPQKNSESLCGTSDSLHHTYTAIAQSAEHLGVAPWFSHPMAPKARNSLKLTCQPYRQLQLEGTGGRPCFLPCESCSVKYSPWSRNQQMSSLIAHFVLAL